MSIRWVRVIWVILILLCLLFWFAFWQTCNAQLAFPGAEGDGAQTVGGRGGRIIKVTNTAATGAGSLKAALQDSSGARIVVFRTGGICTITDDIVISNPYITIAAQTAPGGGFWLKGAGLKPQTHDIIIRGLRILVGDSVVGESYDQRRAITSGISDGTFYNLIVDHCGFRWTTDTQILTRYNWYGVTYQWNIFAEPLNNSLHPKGSTTGGHGYLMVADSVDGITVAHNLFADPNGRSPQLATDTKMRFTGNIVFNWGNSATEIQERSKIDATGNVYIAGTNTSAVQEMEVTGNAAGRVFVDHNIGPSRPTDSGSPWLMVHGTEGNYRSYYPLISEAPVVPTQWSTSRVQQHVLENVGPMPRSAMDSVLIAEVEAGTGSFKDCVKQGVTTFWPFGTCVGSILPNKVVITAPPGGVTADRYLSKLIEVDIDADGTWDVTKTISASTAVSGGQVTITVSTNWSSAPTSSSLFRIYNPCNVNYTSGYPTVSAGTAWPDADNDGISDAGEKFINNNLLDSLSATATRDVDGDGYKDVEDWINEYYYPSLTPKLLGHQ